MPYYVYPDGDAIELDCITPGSAAREVSKREYLVARKAYAVTRLHKLIAVGDTVYTVNTAPNRHRVLVPTIDDNGRNVIRNITHLVADASGFTRNKTTGDISQGGCGYSKSFEIVYSLGSAMWPNGTPVPHGTRNGEPDSTGGYALKQSDI